MGRKGIEIHRTILHIAAMQGHIGICEYLLKKLPQSQKSPIDRYGSTPFHFATERNFFNIMELFKKELEIPLSDEIPLQVVKL